MLRIFFRIKKDKNKEKNYVDYMFTYNKKFQIYIKNIFQEKLFLQVQLSLMM